MSKNIEMMIHMSYLTDRKYMYYKFHLNLAVAELGKIILSYIGLVILGILIRFCLGKIAELEIDRNDQNTTGVKLCVNQSKSTSVRHVINGQRCKGEKLGSSGFKFIMTGCHRKYSAYHYPR